MTHLPRAGAVTVAGAGVLGLSIALALAERGHAVTVVADRAPHETTSAAAGAMCSGSYLTAADAQVRAWALEGLAHFTALATGPDAALAGVSLAEGVSVSRRATGYLPPMAAALSGTARAAAAHELPAGYASGWRYRTAFIDMPRYLAYLLARLEAGGARFIRERLETLEGLGPVVVNATGLGARRLARDCGVSAVRGQLVVLENPGTVTEFFDDTDDAGAELTYIYPHAQSVLLGGTSEPGNEDLSPCERSARQIIDRALRIRPELAGARVIGHRVGLRPARARIRLEAEPAAGGGLVVHCYGHGGAGVSLAHGCARAVAQLVPAAP